jgi:hypothetical protein
MQTQINKGDRVIISAMQYQSHLLTQIAEAKYPRKLQEQLEDFSELKYEYQVTGVYGDRATIQSLNSPDRITKQLPLDCLVPLKSSPLYAVMPGAIPKPHPVGAIALVFGCKYTIKAVHPCDTGRHQYELERCDPNESAWMSDRWSHAMIDLVSD